MIWVVGIGIATSLVGFLAHARWASLWDIAPKEEPVAVITPAPTILSTPVVEASVLTVAAVASVSSPQDERQALNVPIPNKEGIGTTAPTVAPIQAVDVSEVAKEEPVQEKPAKAASKSKVTAAKPTQVPTIVPTKGADLVEKVVDKAAPAAVDGLVKSLF